MRRDGGRECGGIEARNVTGWRPGMRRDGGGAGMRRAGPAAGTASPPQLRAMEGGETGGEPGPGGSRLPLQKPFSAGIFSPDKAELCLAGPGGRFPVAAVDEILREVLGSALREQRYEPGSCREAAKDIAEVVKARVKALQVPRYKIVVVAHIGQLGQQSLQISSRCLWDPHTDTFSSYVFKNTSLFAVANVYGVYFE
ncbi:PREDICTED: tctex1 domain-containing protein 1 [Pseudopodoces humilis]|uniref:tctex1 domain-containing protein 1 n=1 Tax=Pseudopodoces humilis TaxID=181119 RepID=UPI0006B6D879|nr:PREDICTED: tctex1 domain-containing protein 1 [Pseudopodoces humilis]